MIFILEGLCFMACGVIVIFCIAKAIDVFNGDDDANKS
jgi:hypothetical protein